MKLPKAYATSVNKGKIDLTLSVNPLGCSPRALRSLRQMTGRDVSAYPDVMDLNTRLSEEFGVAPENILAGCGSEQLIKLAAQTFLKEGSRVCVENGSFAVFSRESMLAGATVSMTSDLLTGVPDADLSFIANPKTPTGVVMPARDMKTLILASRGVLIIDEANGEFIDSTMIPDAVQSRNTIVLRTFSKVFGLAGIRLGIAVGPLSLINQLRESQQAFPVSQIAIKLTLEALRDKAFIGKTRRFVACERTFLQKELVKRGFLVSASVTNNLFVSAPGADALIGALRDAGVSVINGSFFPGMETEGFRISIKDKRTNREFLRILDEVLACNKRNSLLPSKEDL